MSPAGIPMLYTAEGVETAIAEGVESRSSSRRKGLTIATFAETPRLRHELGFLNGFRRDLSGPLVELIEVERRRLS
jgi:hypothetical protein